MGFCEEPRQDAADSQVAGSAADPQVADLQVADSAAQVRPLQENVKKRRLYRKATEADVVWFPHDNHPHLLKELVWESGTPRWILHGTPASGAGIIGCLEMGVSVIALCDDIHHETNLQTAVTQRAVEAMLAGSCVFKDDDLQARALVLLNKKVTNDKKDEKNEKDDVEESATEKDDKDKMGKMDQQDKKVMKVKNEEKDQKNKKDQKDKKDMKVKKSEKTKRDQKDQKDKKGEKVKKNVKNKVVEPFAGSPMHNSSNSSESSSCSSTDSSDA